MKLTCIFYKVGIAMSFIMVLSASLNAQTDNQDIYKAKNIFEIMRKVGDWQWNTLEQDGWKTSKKDWTSGAMYSGMIAMANISNDETYYNKLIEIGNDNKWQVGKHREEADDYCVGQLYAQLYNVYRNPRYIADFKSLADSLVLLPHTESLEWKNKIDYREWAWCDALFMGPPAFAYLTQSTGDSKYLNKASKLWWKTTDYLMDKDEFLFYRDSRFFAKKEKNGAKVFWSRGNGWVMGGLVKVLSVMKKTHPDSARFAKLLKDMSHKVASLQQPDGTWHASLLDPASFPSKEISGTGFFCYAMAWGINHRILPADEYLPVVKKAWKAMVDAVHSNGKLGYVQAQGAAPDKVGFEDTDVYGVGAFLLAGREMIYLDANFNGHKMVIEVINPGSKLMKISKKIPWSAIQRQFKWKKTSAVFLNDICTGQRIPGMVEYSAGKKPVAVNFSLQVLPGTNRIFQLQIK